MPTGCRTTMDGMTTICKGAKRSGRAAAVRAELSWTGGAGVPDVDGSALLLQESGRVAADDDFVFYNQPRHPSGAVRHAGKSGTRDTVEVDLARPAGRRRPGRARRLGRRRARSARCPACASCSPTAAPAREIAEFAIAAGPGDGDAQRRAVPAQRAVEVPGHRPGLRERSGRPGHRLRHLGRRRPACAPPAAAAPQPAARRPGRRPPTTPAPPRCRPRRHPGRRRCSRAASPFPGPSGAPPGADPAQPNRPPVNLDKGRVSLVKGARVSLVKTRRPAARQGDHGPGLGPAAPGKSIDLDASAIAFDAAGSEARDRLVHAPEGVRRRAACTPATTSPARATATTSRSSSTCARCRRTSRRSSSRSPRSAARSSPRSRTRSAAWSTTDSGAGTRPLQPVRGRSPPAP